MSESIVEQTPTRETLGSEHDKGDAIRKVVALDTGEVNNLVINDYRNTTVLSPGLVRISPNVARPQL